MTISFQEIQQLIAQKSFECARTSLLHYIQERPEFVPAYFELSRLYINSKQEHLAIALLQEAVLKQPNSIGIHLILAEIYYHNLEQYIYPLIALYEKLNGSGYKDAIMLFRLSYLYKQTFNEKAYEESLLKAYNVNKEAQNFDLILQYQIIGAMLFYFNYQKQNNFYEKYAEKMKGLPELKINFKNKYSTHKVGESKKIRLGFVSGDIRDHSVNHFLKTVLQNLDKNKYELIAFPTLAYEDAETQKSKKYFDKWIPVGNNLKSVQEIHNCAIDILFDLSGHTGHNGLLLFKYKPARIQASWLGYFASTGVPEMDYFITSEKCVLKEEEGYFTEKVLKLPETYLSYDFSHHCVELPSTMAYEKNNYITFGFYQNLSKVVPQDKIIWKKILQEISTARLIIKASELSQLRVREEFSRSLVDLGLDMQRIEVRGNTSLSEHLKQHNDVDIMLDAYNISGCTTTCQSLYMGVPIIAFKGSSMLTRHAEQFLSIVGLENFIVSAEDEFIKVAQKYSNNLEELKNIKVNLRPRVLNSSIGNAHLFTQQFEGIINKMLEGS